MKWLFKEANRKGLKHQFTNNINLGFHVKQTEQQILDYNNGIFSIMTKFAEETEMTKNITMLVCTLKCWI